MASYEVHNIVTKGGKEIRSHLINKGTITSANRRIFAKVDETKIFKSRKGAERAVAKFEKYGWTGLVIIEKD